MNLNAEKARMITDTVLENINIDTMLKRQHLTVAGQAALIHAMIKVYIVSEAEGRGETTQSDAMIAKIHKEQPWMETTNVVNNKSFPAIMQAIRQAMNGHGLSVKDLADQTKKAS